MTNDTPIPKPSDEMVRLDPTASVNSAPPQISDHELPRCVRQGAGGEMTHSETRTK
jgi:hypothetical protein